MKKILQISNIIALLITIAVNYLSTSGVINGKTVANISDKYHTLFTPASYAFGIWALIYLMLLGFVIYQGTSLFDEAGEKDFVMQIGWWFVISCAANSVWIIVWINEWTGLSVLIIGILLFSLMKIVVNTNMERWDAPLPKIGLLWWPFCVYSGWVTVAFFVNMAAYLTKTGWYGIGIGDAGWAIIMAIFAGTINVFMIWSRNMREFAATGIWALVAIAFANWNSHPAVVWTTITISAILFVNISIHAYLNRATSPMVKLQQMRNG